MHAKTSQTVHANKQRIYANQWAQFLNLLLKWFPASMAMFFTINTAAKSTSPFVQLILSKDVFFPEVKTQFPVSVRAKQVSEDKS